MSSADCSGIQTSSPSSMRSFSDKAAVRAFNKDQLRLLITDSCNLTCTYCHNEGQFGKGHYMPLQVVRALAGWIANERVYVRSLVLSGGEPTVHPHLVKIVEALRNSADHVSMVTNGIRLSRGFINDLATAGMSYIKFGIDATDEAAQTKGPLRRSPGRGAGAAVLENALYANQVMPGSHLNTVISSYNLDKLRDLVTWCDQCAIGAKFLELIEVRPEIERINPHGASRQHSWFGMLYSKVCDLISDVEYNPKVMKFFAKTKSGQVLQFSENFCAFGLCANLWSRIDSLGRLIPCIQCPTTRPFSLDHEAIAQVELVNKEMRQSQLWPCGAGKMDPPVGDSDNVATVLLPNGSTIDLPLTTKSSCVG